MGNACRLLGGICRLRHPPEEEVQVAARGQEALQPAHVSFLTVPFIGFPSDKLACPKKRSVRFGSSPRIWHILRELPKQLVQHSKAPY